MVSHPRFNPSLSSSERRRRWVRRSFATVLLLSAFAAGYAVHAFIYLVNPPDRRDWSHGNVERARITSPDGSLDAVVYCYCDTPAMVSPYFYFHIFPKGRKVGQYSSPAVVVSRRDLKLEWVDRAHVRVDPAQGTIEYFTNLWAPNDDQHNPVEIILAQDPANRLLTQEGHFASLE